MEGLLHFAYCGPKRDEGATRVSRRHRMRWEMGVERWISEVTAQVSIELSICTVITRYVIVIESRSKEREISGHFKYFLSINASARDSNDLVGLKPQVA